MTPNNFIGGSYITAYWVSPDAVDASLAIAFEFVLSDQSIISCGTLEGGALGDDYYESENDCSVIPFAFNTGWTESDPPYLV